MDFVACIRESSESPTRLLNLLEIKASTLGINTNDKLPKSASHLSRKLKELVTTLREIGIEVKWSSDSKKNTRTIIIKNVSYVPHVPPTKEDQAQYSERDDDNPDRFTAMLSILTVKKP